MRAVLIVDDDADLVECFAELLRLRGHALRTALCGEDGLRMGTRYFVAKGASAAELTHALDRALRERIAPSSA